MIKIMTKNVHDHDHYKIITVTIFSLGTQSFLGSVVPYVTYGTLNMTSSLFVPWQIILLGMVGHEERFLTQQEAKKIEYKR